LFHRLKRKAELMGTTLAKSLRASAVVINRTVAHDVAWIERLQAAKERLKQQEAMAQAEAGVSVVTGSDPAAQGSGPSEVAAPSTGGAELGSSSTAKATVEAAMAEASIRDAERAGADVVMEEVLPAVGQEAAQPREPQPQQDPPAEPAATVEGGVVEPPPVVLEEEVLVVEGPAPVEGSMPAMVDLTLDDSPLDKGKQVVGVEGVEAVDQAGPSAVVMRPELRVRLVLPRGWRAPRLACRPSGRTSPRWP
jgi:hypothetical protein